ncbi:MAG: FAD-binding oxidoreductase [Dehalococcoidia bacterium]|nr:FAD-binding oxidoreductase [Dehalococcoidia bacterium]
MLITVVGAGVAGLTTALALQERGHRVQVVAEHTGDGTTSAVAGAVWYPFRADPPELVTGWAMRTKEWLTQLAADTPAAGVDILTVREATATAEVPWWASCTPDLQRVTLPGGTGAWQFEAPRVQPGIHLEWLASQLAWPIERRRVVSLDAEPGDMVVNCTGLGARNLTGDRELQALWGQTVLVAPGEAALDAVAIDERDAERMFYSIPRRGSVVLGGCAVATEDDHSLAPVEALSADILRRASERNRTHGPVLAVRCGLRPYRTTVRLEREGRIIHNYGHGGSGFTLARGCAEQVAAMAES